MQKKNIVLFIMLLILLTGCTKEVENKNLTITLNNEEISGTFTGTLIDNAANGDGEFRASVDYGEWTYTGTFENNAIIGDGVFQNYPYILSIPNYSFDVVYDGVCFNGLPTGKGTVNGKVNDLPFEYKGDFLQGNLNGNGEVFNYPHSLTYENTKINGVYSGDLLDGTITGQGEFKDMTSEIDFAYSGEWNNGNMSNVGHLKCDNYIVHFGDADGAGNFDGDTYNGIPEGNGTFESTDENNIGYTYVGSWSNGLWNGYGEVIYDEHDNNTIDKKGTFIDGKFTPTPSEFMLYYSGSNSVKFKVTDETKNYIAGNEDYFGENAITTYPDGLIKDVSYEEYAKRSYAYPELFIKTECKVENIWEYDIKTAASDTTTEIYCSLTDDLLADYDVIYFGSLPDVYAKTKINIIGIPVAYGSVDNVLGGQNSCIFLLASKIEIVQ